MSDPSKRARENARMLGGEVREAERGNLPVENMDGNLAAIVEDHDTRAFLGFAQAVYDRRKGPEDPPFEETQFARTRLELAGNEAIHDAVETGNVSKMSHSVGWPEYENDASSLHTAAQLEDWLCTSEQCKLIYLAALMGRGKTDLALSFLALVSHYYGRAEDALSGLDHEQAGSVPTPEFAANFAVSTPSDAPNVRLINDFDALQAWGDQGDSSQVRWFIFDEASTELTAQSGENAQDVAETMGPFVKKMRKMGINMIVIGHDKGDVHVAIRSLADYVDKKSLKSASFYAGINSREGVGHLFDAHKIPSVTEAGWSFDTDDLAEWSWGTALDGDLDGAGQPSIGEAELKRMVAIRAADVYESVESLNKEDTVQMFSKGEISISRRMLDNARKGQYQDVMLA